MSLVKHIFGVEASTVNLKRSDVFALLRLELLENLPAPKAIAGEFRKCKRHERGFCVHLPTGAQKSRGILRLCLRSLESIVVACVVNFPV